MTQRCCGIQNDLPQRAAGGVLKGHAVAIAHVQQRNAAAADGRSLQIGQDGLNDGRVREIQLVACVAVEDPDAGHLRCLYPSEKAHRGPVPQKSAEQQQGKDQDLDQLFPVHQRLLSLLPGRYTTWKR